MFRNTEGWAFHLGLVLSALHPLFPCRALMKLIYLHRSDNQIKTLTSIKKKVKKDKHESRLIAVGKNSIPIFR